jgi:Protein of unknown function (DUF2946)
VVCSNPLHYNLGMRWLTFTRRKLISVFIARIVLIALALTNVAPAFSSAIGYISGSPKQAQAFSAINVICTSAGLRFLGASNAEHSPGSPQPIHSGSHCPWCALSGPPSLPVNSSALFLHAALAHVEVDNKPATLANAPIWLQNLPRGPPAFSA